MKYFAKIEPKNIVTITSTIYFGRGRGRGAQAPSSRGKGAGRRRGAYKPSAADFLVYSQTSKSRKRNKIYPEKSKFSAEFWSGLNSNQDSDDEEDDQANPRKDENWKIQKRKGFMKEREDKLSKTEKRNSNEPLVPKEKPANKNVDTDTKGRHH